MSDMRDDIASVLLSAEEIQARTEVTSPWPA